MMENFIENVLSKLRSELLVKVGINEGDSSTLEKEELLSLIALFSEAAKELKSALIEEPAIRFWL